MLATQSSPVYNRVQCRNKIIAVIGMTPVNGGVVRNI